MSKLSLYEPAGLVFENKTKNGVYHCVKKVPKLPCLHFYGFTIICFSSKYSKDYESQKNIVNSDSIDQIIQVTKIFPNQVKKLNNHYRKQSNKTYGPHCKTTAHKSNNKAALATQILRKQWKHNSNKW
jgi:hypothetical protein